MKENGPTTTQENKKNVVWKMVEMGFSSSVGFRVDLTDEFKNRNGTKKLAHMKQN